MDYAAVQQGLAAAADNVSGLRGLPYLRDAIQPPVFVVGEIDIDYDRTFRTASAAGLTENVVTGRLYVSRADDRTGQAKLVGYLAPDGSLSVKAAIETDRTLGGACKTLRVERVRGYGVYQVAGVEYLGARFDIRVWG